MQCKQPHAILIIHHMGYNYIVSIATTSFCNSSLLTGLIVSHVTGPEL